MNFAKTENECYAFHPLLTYLGSPVFVKVIDACDATAVAIGVIHVTHVPCPVSRVTRHHRLKKTKMKSTVSKSRCSGEKKQKGKAGLRKKKKVFPPSEL